MCTSEEMFPVVEDWLQSGLTQKEYSQCHQIALHILPYWVGRYRKEKLNPLSQSPQPSLGHFISVSTDKALINGMESDRCGSLTHRCGDPLWQYCTGSLSAATAISMFGLSSSQRFFLYHAACDMRKGLDGLSGVVQQEMGHDACSGDVYIFLS